MAVSERGQTEPGQDSASQRRDLSIVWSDEDNCRASLPVPAEWQSSYSILDVSGIQSEGAGPTDSRTVGQLK